MHDKKKIKPERIKNILPKIRHCVEESNYSFTSHAFARHNERKITLPEVLHVLKNGYEEKSKTKFTEEHNAWKYAIRGKTIRDEIDIRIIVAFDENNMMIITVMRVEKL